MIESRAVTSKELDSMLSLMCDAFGLPFGPARDLFYKDPYFDIDKKRVLIADGEMVSCLTIVEAPLWIGKAVVRVGGIAGVATLLAHRRKGYAERLLLDTLPVLRDMGCGFSALFPFSYGYYRKLGWERAGTQYLLRMMRGGLSEFREARYVRGALPADRAEIAELYMAHAMHKPGRWSRDSKRWSYLYEHAKHQIVYKRQAVEGYALYETQEEAGGQRRLRILEMFCGSQDARRGLIGFFAKMKDAKEVTYTASLSEILASGLAAQAEIEGDGGPRIESQPGVMFRVVDIAAALTALAPNFEGWQGELTLTMTDRHAPKNLPHSCAAARLDGDGAAVTVTPLGPRDPACSSPNRIEGDVQAWTQLLTGFHSLADALSLNRLRAFSPDAAGIAEPLFPRRELFVPPPDHF